MFEFLFFCVRMYWHCLWNIDSLKEERIKQEMIITKILKIFLVDWKNSSKQNQYLLKAYMIFTLLLSKLSTATICWNHFLVQKALHSLNLFKSWRRSSWTHPLLILGTCSSLLKIFSLCYCVTFSGQSSTSCFRDQFQDLKI